MADKSFNAFEMAQDQFDKVADMIDNDPVKLERSNTAMTPACNDLMSRDDDAGKTEQYHNIVQKVMFRSKHQGQTSACCRCVSDESEGAK